MRGACRSCALKPPGSPLLRTGFKLRVRASASEGPARPAALVNRQYPKVDWSRFHLQVLFVDAHDSGTARVFQGVFDSIAAWNGLGRTFAAWTCGLQPSVNLPERTLALVSFGRSLGISETKLFTRVPEQVDIRDLYIYDIICTTSPEVQEQVLGIFDVDLSAQWDNEADREYYRDKVCVIADFMPYATNEQIRQLGGQALVPPNLQRLLGGDVEGFRRVHGVDSVASMHDAVWFGDKNEWQHAVQAMVVAAAGLNQYLMDSYPDDLVQFWLE